VGLDGAEYVGLDGAKYVGLDGARWVYMELGGARWNLVKHKGPNHLDLVAAIASCGNMTFQSFFFPKCFRFGNRRGPGFFTFHEKNYRKLCY
jgi:hypothetical protein